MSGRGGAIQTRKRVLLDVFVVFDVQGMREHQKHALMGVFLVFTVKGGGVGWTDMLNTKKTHPRGRVFGVQYQKVRKTRRFGMFFLLSAVVSIGADLLDMLVGSGWLGDVGWGVGCHVGGDKQVCHRRFESGSRLGRLYCCRDVEKL